MSLFGKLEKVLRPVLFYGNNWISLIGGALTSASAFVLVGFWVVSFFGHGGSANPYLGIIFDLFLPGLFILGLVLIPIGIWQRRRHLTAIGELPSVYPQINLKDPVFRRGIEIVIAATFINFVIVGTASYRGVSYMDSANFCGQSCHVMAPQWAAYQVSPHSNVACVECHIGSGFSAAVEAKVNGTKQLVEVTLGNYPRPILAPLSVLRPARATCEACHSPTRFVGEKLLVETMYGDDEKNSVTRTVLALHLGGVDSLSHLSGIHGHHLDHYEYVATDSTYQTIIAVNKHNADGSITQFVSSDWKGPVKGVTRQTQLGDPHLPDRRGRHRRGDGGWHPQRGPSLCPQGGAATDSGGVRIAGRGGHEDHLGAGRLLPHPVSGGVGGPARSGGRGRQDPGRHLPAQRLPRDEGRLGHLSQRHGAQRAGAQSIPRMLPLPRRQPHLQGRQDHHQRL